MRLFRNHGINIDHTQRKKLGSWFYEMIDLGYNYRLSDIQSALANSQLGKLAIWVERRQEIARKYDTEFRGIPALKPLTVRPDVSHAYHLYVVRLDLSQLRGDRGDIFTALRADGIGVNVHYIPVHLHPYFKENLGTGPGLCPEAEAAYEEIITLPLFPRMTDDDVNRVIGSVKKVISNFLA